MPRISLSWSTWITAGNLRRATGGYLRPSFDETMTLFLSDVDGEIANAELMLARQKSKSQ
jgi:hypothetical protein